jgi:hypothetical protein
MFTIAGALAGQLGEPLPAACWQRLEAAGAHLRALLDRRGHHPRIGDDDEGRAIAAPGPEPYYVASVLSMLSALRQRPDLAPPRPARALRNVLFGAAAAHPQPAPGVRHFAQGGYTVARFTAGGAEALLVVDHGPLGFLSIAAHGHADALALWLHLDGAPVLIDAGTHRYYGAGTWRDTLRGTAAHNTLCVAGADSSRIAGRFHWSHKARVELVEWSEDGAGAWTLTARHAGSRRRFGCDHQRTVRQVSGERIEIVDRLVGAGGPWPVEIGFLLAPDLDLAAAADGVWRVCRGSQPLLALAAQGPLSGSVQNGLEEPRAGWCSPAYGALVPTRRLVFAGRLSAADEVRFSLLLGTAAGRPPGRSPDAAIGVDPAAPAATSHLSSAEEAMAQAGCGAERS